MKETHCAPLKRRASPLERRVWPCRFRCIPWLGRQRRVAESPQPTTARATVAAARRRLARPEHSRRSTPFHSIGGT